MIIPLCHWESSGITVQRPGISGSAIDHMLATTPERVALDLHVGSDYQVDFHEWRQMPEQLTLRPNDCVRIRVEEEITTSVKVFGQVCSKGGLSPEGLLVANQKVDPNFSGPLELAVFNAGKAPVKVNQGAAFASMWMGTLGPPLADAPQLGVLPGFDEAAPRRIATPTQGIESRGLQEKLRAAAPFILTGIVSTASAVAASLLEK